MDTLTILQRRRGGGIQPSQTTPAAHITSLQSSGSSWLSWLRISGKMFSILFLIVNSNEDEAAVVVSVDPGTAGAGL